MASRGYPNSNLINGRMTLAELEKVTGVPTDYVIEQLGLRLQTGKDQGLGTSEGLMGSDGVGA